MSSSGNLLSSLGTAMAAAFPGHALVYGMPVDASYIGTGDTVFVHLMQEREELLSQSLLGGRCRILPTVAVTVSQAIPASTDESTISTHTARWDIAAEIRAALVQWILSSVSTPISGVGAISLSDLTTTPAGSPVAGRESVTVQASISYTRNLGAA